MGFVPGRRSMYGHQCAHVKELLTKFSVNDFANGGLVDFVLGAEPHTGAFVVGYNDHPVKRKYMSYFKMGDGPLYVFYTPLPSSARSAAALGRSRCALQGRDPRAGRQA